MKCSIQILLLTVACSCGSRSDVDFIKGSRFYQDYDVFQRRGVHEIDSANLEIPFIQEYTRTDSIITLRIYDTDLNNFQEVQLPSFDGVVLKRNSNASDAPNWIFGTISGNKILRYGYNSDPFDNALPAAKEIYLYDLVPDYIQVITRDTIKTIFYQSYLADSFGVDINRSGDWTSMRQHLILPFKAKVDLSYNFEKLKDNVHIETIKDSADFYIQSTYVMDRYDSYIHKTQFRDSVRLGSRYANARPFKLWRDYLNPLRGM